MSLDSFLDDLTIYASDDYDFLEASASFDALPSELSTRNNPQQSTPHSDSSYLSSTYDVQTANNNSSSDSLLRNPGFYNDNVTTSRPAYQFNSSLSGLTSHAQINQVQPAQVQTVHASKGQVSPAYSNHASSSHAPPANHTPSLTSRSNYQVSPHEVHSSSRFIPRASPVAFQLDRNDASRGPQPSYRLDARHSYHFLIRLFSVLKELK